MRAVRTALWLSAVGMGVFWLEAAVHRFRGYVCLAPLRRRCPVSAPWFSGSTIEWLVPVFVLLLLAGCALLSIVHRRAIERRSGPL